MLILSWVAQSSSAATILQYHHISDKTPAATSISPALFRRHLLHLEQAGYAILPLHVMIADLKAGRTLPDKSVAITFDDGYDSVYREAFPLLKEKGWPFTVFVNTQPLERGAAGFVTWDQLNEMADHGATIANHSHTHTHLLRRLTNENESRWRARIQEDIQTAEHLIRQHTGQLHKLLAYPYGEYDRATKRLVAELGFIAFGQQSGPIADSVGNGGSLDFLALPRFPFGGPYGDEDDFKVKVATLPMPIKATMVLSQAGGKLIDDTLLPQSVQKPLLQIELRHALAAPVQCFASGQGTINTDLKGTHVTARAKQPLPVGRSRYNCTSASSEPGRFYWYSQFFIRKQADGNWYPEP